MTGNGYGQVMDASSSGKRKSSEQPSSDSDSEGSAAQIHVKEYANTALNISCSSATTNITDADLTVAISGRNRPLKY